MDKVTSAWKNIKGLREQLVQAAADVDQDTGNLMREAAHHIGKSNSLLYELLVQYELSLEPNCYIKRIKEILEIKND